MASDLHGAGGGRGQSPDDSPDVPLRRDQAEQRPEQPPAGAHPAGPGQAPASPDPLTQAHWRPGAPPTAPSAATPPAPAGPPAAEPGSFWQPGDSPGHSGRLLWEPERDQPAQWQPEQTQPAPAQWQEHAQAPGQSGQWQEHAQAPGQWQPEQEQAPEQWQRPQGQPQWQPEQTQPASAQWQEHGQAPEQWQPEQTQQAPGQWQAEQSWPTPSGPGLPPGARPELWGLQGAPPPEPAPNRGRRRLLVALVAIVAVIAAGVAAAFTIAPLGIALGLRPSPRELATKAADQFLTGWQDANYPAMQALMADPRDNMERVYGGMAQRLKVTKTVVTPGKLAQDGVTMPYTVTLTLKGLGPVSWSSVVHLRQISNSWRVKFSSDTVYPGLANGQRLDLLASTTNRGEVVDRHGESLRNDDDLSGNLVGRSGKNGVGATGLERVFNDQLGGTPTTRLAVVIASNGDAINVVKEWNAKPGQNVTTTLDLGLQRDAERALANVNGTAALVAIDTSTGEIRAMASHPTSGLPAAFASYYAPGSTFKIITATAALMAGSTPQSPEQCTQNVTVDGRTFKNAEKAPSQTLSLTQAFAQSCNTAFIRLAGTLPSGALRSAAALYGFDGSQPLPIASTGGQIPAPASTVEAAADAIGQGRVEASPLQMASVAAGVASGTWHQPHLIANCASCASHQIPVAQSLQSLMRAVVTSGTGTAAKNVPGAPVYGKTGTAEFGTGTPLPTHAWFVGWQGNLAFAVFVERGAFGGTVAAPIAAKFLEFAAAG